MPNHCCNTLTIAKEAMPVIIQNYIRLDEEGERIFDFERIELVDDIPDWYEQRRKKWGTKWVGYDLSIGDTAIDFFSAWTPPLPIIKKLAELHKDFVFHLEYYEIGDGFRGIYIAKWQKGKVLTEEKEWNMTKKDYKELGLS